MLSVTADKIFQKHNAESSHDGTDQSSSTSKDHHQKDFSRGYDVQITWPNITVVIDVEDSGDSGKKACENEGDILIDPGIVSESTHASFAISYPFQSQTKWGLCHQRYSNHCNDEKKQRKIIINCCIGKIQLDEDEVRAQNA